MTSTTLEFYERVVYIALTRMTKDRGTIQSAFRFWRTELASGEFDIPSIVQRIEAYIGIDGAEKKALFVSMQAAVNRMHDELPPVPQALLAGQAQVENELPQTPEIASANSAHYDVTVAILRQISQQIYRDARSDFEDMKSALREEASDIVDDKRLSQALEQWAEEGLGQLKLPGDISEDECAELFHAFSMLVSEFIGPVESDKLVNAALSSAMRMPQAASFDPRDLM